MSGHSKWTQIKRQKGVADIKRGQAFTKLAVAITIAVRQGGGVGDPSQNFKLRLIVEKARALNMPKENIERAIQRAFGKSGVLVLEEVVYEGFAPGHVSVIVEAATDNKQRTINEVKNIFDKNGGTLASPGAVSYQFEKRGLITVKKNGTSVDDVFLLAADSGAQDVEEMGDEVVVYTKPEDLAAVRDALVKKITVTDAEITRVPTVTVPLSDKDIAQKALSFIEKLESLDDVQKVYANFDISDGLLQSVGSMA